jgi:hypothetical protein
MSRLHKTDIKDYSGAFLGLTLTGIAMMVLGLVLAAI